MGKYLKASQVCVHGFDAAGRAIWYTYNNGLLFRGTTLTPGKPLELGLTWQAKLIQPFSGAHLLRAHERHQLHPAKWATRPIRGRAPGDTPEWVPGPEKYVRQVVLDCLACGHEGYTEVTSAQYQAMLEHTIVVRIQPCPRCGGRRSWEPFILITAVPERVYSMAHGS